MASITIKPGQELTITWPLLPDDFELPDEPAENTELFLIQSRIY